MGMLGNQLAAGQALTVANDSFNGDGSTVAFTLSQTVSSVNDIEVLVDNVQQSPYDSSYSVSGTTLTFSGAPSTGTNNVYVIYNASKHITTQQVIPDDGSVTHSKFHTTALNPITLDPSNNRVGIGTASPSYTLHSSTSTGSDFAGFFHNGAGSGNGTALVAKGGANNSGAGTFIVQDYGGNEDFKVDGLGRVTKPNQPAFSVLGHSSDTNLATNSSNITIPFGDTPSFNIGGGWNSANSRFTAPVAGRYFFYTECMLKTNIDNWNYLITSFNVNGGGTNIENMMSKPNGGSFATGTCTAIFNLAAGDYVTVWMRQSGGSGNAIVRNGYRQFTGYLLG